MLMRYQDMHYQEENSLTSVDTAAANRDLSTAKVPGRVHQIIWRINWHRIGSWLCTWEVYPIVLLAGFLRFYQISSSEFDADQSTVFGMAYDAIHHGLIPATSNIASIRIVNPPAVIYIFMLVAAFTSNPLWGVILVGIFNLAAVLLTYVFVRRYFGRLAGIIAALLYGTAATPLFYSRFIWQQNLIAPFAVLFLFALFWGAVERRSGWIFPALVLLGILVQLHETTILLAVPFLAALLLAPGTLRWRDLVSGLIALFLLFFTYLLWEVGTHFNDLHVLLLLKKLSAYWDNFSLLYYINFLSPYNRPPTNTHALVYSLVPLLNRLPLVMLFLVVGGFVVALIGIVFPDQTVHSFRHWWASYYASPEGRGLLLLLIWQIVPLLILSHHSVPLYPYYLLMLMPGPFILIGIFLSAVSNWFQRLGHNWNIGRFVVYAVVFLVVLAQFMGNVAVLTDEASGTNRHSYAFDTLGSLQAAMSETDQLAHHHHFNRVYIATDQYTQSSLDYLAEKMRTPTTLFDAANCLVLPGPANGPAVLLVGPSDTLTTLLLKQFATTTLVDRPARLGGQPFQLYIVAPLTEPAPHPAPYPLFVHHLQLIDRKAHMVSFEKSSFLVSRWSIMRSEPPGYRTTYNYLLSASFKDAGNNGRGARISIKSYCASTALRAGDQLIVAFSLANLPAISSPPASLTVNGWYFTTVPFNLSYGPFHLETIWDQRGAMTPLQTADGLSSIKLSVSP
jgi:4-amino-4-deoxy-L-arabinose transferase-like glycosyltransferase